MPVSPDFRAESAAAPEISGMRRSDAGAIPPAHQQAILGLAQIGNTHGQPDAYRGQCHGKGERRHVRQHAMAKIVGFLPGSLIAREIVCFLPSIARLAILARRLGHRARAELEHAVLVIRSNWPLAFHLCRIRDIRCPLLSLSGPAPQTKSAWHACDNSFRTGVRNPPWS